MNKLTNLLRKISLCFVIMTCAITSSLFGKGINIRTAFAELDYTPSKVGTVSTSFASSSSSYPLNVSGWTSTGTSDNVTKGIISTDKNNYKSSTYEEVTKLSFNPGTKNEDDDDNNILMINAGEQRAKSGYTTPAIELEAKSYYHISIDVYTAERSDNFNSFASVKLSGGDFSSLDEAYYSHIQTSNTWQTVNFYIASDSLNKQEIKVELKLGNNETYSYGVVFFDNFLCERISNNQYMSKRNIYSDLPNKDSVNVNDEDVVIVNYISFVDVSDYQNYIDISSINPDFEENITGWTPILTDFNPENEYIAGVYKIGIGTFDSTALKTQDPSNAFRYNNTSALLINNIVSNSYGFKSSDISIGRNRVYALSVDVKTGNNGTATINLKQKNVDDSENFSAKTASFDSISTSSDSTNAHGGWETFTFVIKGNYAEESILNIELCVNNSAGYAWFDNITLQEITFEDYSSFSNGNSIKILDLATFNETLIKNGLFNDVTSNEIGGKLLPNSWTVSTNAINPDNVSVTVTDKDTYINTLKIENKITTGTMVTSSDISASNSQMFLLTFDAKVEQYNNAVPYIAIYVDDTLLYTLPLSNSSYDWLSYKLGIVNIDLYSTIKIAICLGGMDENDTKVKGVVYFDNFKLDSTDESTISTLDNVANFKITDFASDYDKINDTTNTKLYKSLSYSSTLTDEQVVYGILDLNNFERLSANNFPNLPNPKSNVGNYVYVVNSEKDTYFYVDSKKIYSLGGGQYHKLTVSLKTIGLGQDKENYDKDAVAYGAFIALSNMDGAKITSIDTSDIKINNGYATYSLYLYTADPIETNIRFGLGQSDSMTKGSIIVESIDFENVTEDDFDAAKSDATGKVVTYKYSESGINDEEDKEITPEEPENKVDFNFLVLPTLITALALIIAIVGVLVRRYGHKRNVKVKNQYDKTNVVKSHNLRQSIADKEALLEELNTELEAAEIELVESQPNMDMTDEQIIEAKDKSYDLENKIGALKENIAQTSKDIENLKNQLNKI